jgi:hypothetical protein
MVGSDCPRRAEIRSCECSIHQTVCSLISIICNEPISCRCHGHEARIVVVPAASPQPKFRCCSPSHSSLPTFHGPRYQPDNLLSLHMHVRSYNRCLQIIIRVVVVHLHYFVLSTLHFKTRAIALCQICSTETLVVHHI